jgi:hypothetical protein
MSSRAEVVEDFERQRREAYEQGLRLKAEIESWPAVLRNIPSRHDLLMERDSQNKVLLGRGFTDLHEGLYE